MDINVNEQQSKITYEKFNFPHKYPLYPPKNEDGDSIITLKSPCQSKDPGFKGIGFDRTSEYPINQQVFNIRLANSKNIREKAESLIKKKYSWRGYSFNERLTTGSNKITLIADDTRGRTVGTMTLCLDKQTGLPADENFFAELDELRSQGHKISEPSKLAIEENIPKHLFAAMIHIAYIYAYKIHRCTDWVIEINPRHAAFYKKMLGFQNYGKDRICTRVNAPATLMRLRLEHMAEQINKFGGLMEHHGKERTFYPYFFSIWDEPNIVKKLTRSAISTCSAPQRLSDKQPMYQQAGLSLAG